MEENKPVKTRATFERNSKYDKPEVEDKVVQLRKDGSTWEEITSIIKADIDEPSMSRDMSKKIFDRAMTKTLTVKGPALRTFEKNTDALEGMSKKAMKVLYKWVNAADKLGDRLDAAVEDGTMDVIKVYGIYMKTAGSMKTVLSELREFMKMELDQQKRISLEMKDEIMSTEQILDLINKSQEKQVKEGKYIKVKEKFN